MTNHGWLEICLSIEDWSRLETINNNMKYAGYLKLCMKVIVPHWPFLLELHLFSSFVPCPRLELALTNVALRLFGRHVLRVHTNIFFAALLPNEVFASEISRYSLGPPYPCFNHHTNVATGKVLKVLGFAKLNTINV